MNSAQNSNTLTFVFLLLGCGALTAADLTGHKLLLTSVRTGNTEVFIVDPETGDAQNVSRSPKSEDRYPCWSPDGKRICFLSDRAGATNLWIANADGSKVRRLNRTPAVCYFGKHGDKPEMASIKPDGSGEEMFGVGHDPTLSPDGKLICYTGEVPGGVSVFVMNHDGTNKRRIVEAKSQVGATFPNWSPDSRRIVYSFPGAALDWVLVLDDSTKNFPPPCQGL